GIRLDDGWQRELSAGKWGHVGRKRWLPDGSGVIVVAREQRLNVDRLWLVKYPSGEALPISNELDGFNDVCLTGAGHTMVADQMLPVCEIWHGPLTDSAGSNKIGVWGMAGAVFLAGGRRLYLCKGMSAAPEIR